MPDEKPLIEQIIADIDALAAGRTRYEGQEPYRDEALVAEIRRLRDALAHCQGNLEANRRAAGTVIGARDAKVKALEGMVERRERERDRLRAALRKAEPFLAQGLADEIERMIDDA